MAPEAGGLGDPEQSASSEGGTKQIEGARNRRELKALSRQLPAQKARFYQPNNCVALRLFSSLSFNPSEIDSSMVSNTDLSTEQSDGLSSEGKVRRRSVHANGLNFPIYEAGQGPLVLCLHGFPDHARSWAPILERLARAGFWAVAPALRGYWDGGAAPDGNYRASAIGRDVLEIIVALGEEQADLVGHDLGARAAYAAASMDASKVHKLVGIAVPYGPKMGAAFVENGDQQRRSWYMFLFQMHFAERAVQLNDFALIDRLWREWSPGFELSSTDRAALKETLGQKGVIKEALAYYRQLFTPPNDERLKELESQATSVIRVPSLYFHGAEDGCISAEFSEGMEAAFPLGLTRIVMKDAGHFLHLERPDAFSDQVIAFLSDGRSSF
ncbi:alpha/beta fold hydrolase [Tardiphaga sp. 804_B3_N1_9]|uniref:alpha/beta fold hydrolase n=1 Tax=Tardiphaga sp. 804_B3_N1_9 TaxID=3240786 RepID=UPI003F23B787